MAMQVIQERMAKEAPLVLAVPQVMLASQVQQDKVETLPVMQETIR